MTFTEAATVKRMVLDTVARPRRSPAIGDPPLEYPGSLGPSLQRDGTTATAATWAVPRSDTGAGTPDTDPGKSSQKSSQKILEAVRRDPSVTIADLAEEVGITDRAIKKQIEKLKEQGRLRRIGPDRGGHWEIPE